MSQKDEVFEYIKSHSGSNEEKISQDLNMDMVDLTEILRELHREGKIRRVQGLAI